MSGSGRSVRGDTEAIRIGSSTNIQDACVLHADPGLPCVIGDRVTVGHAAIVHGAVVEQDVMIGMRAVILNGARIGTGSIIGAGAVVAEGTTIEPNSLVFGLPGKRVRATTEEQRTWIARAAEHYVAAAGLCGKMSRRSAGPPHPACGPILFGTLFARLIFAYSGTAIAPSKRRASRCVVLAGSGPCRLRGSEKLARRSRHRTSKGLSISTS